MMYKKSCLIVCEHLDLYFSLSSVKFKVVSGQDLQLFNSIKSGDSLSQGETTNNPYSSFWIFLFNLKWNLGGSRMYTIS